MKSALTLFTLGAMLMTGTALSRQEPAARSPEALPEVKASRAADLARL